MKRVVAAPTSHCRLGLALADITPPVGMYHRMWGAATHDRSEGIHRPLRATALALAPNDSADKPPFVLVALDHCLLWGKDMAALREPILRAAGLSPERLVITFSHTHAAGLLDLTRRDLPGGELIEPYLRHLTAQVVELVLQASSHLQPAVITFDTGRCNLAVHRDAWDDEAQRWVCGFHPEGPTDDTLLIARVTSLAGETLATIVNYGCHPTTLAWENRLVSPDYPGALRETIEDSTGAPCVFLLGACGDLGPREGYVGDSAVADRNGRQLAYAALSALAGMSPPDAEFAYQGPVISGATLGDWRYRPLSAERQTSAKRFVVRHITVPLLYRADRPQLEDLQNDRTRWQAAEQQAISDGNELGARDARAMVERCSRAITRWEACPPGETYPYDITLLQLGDAIVVMVEGEPYHVLQTELRRRFPDTPIFVLVLCNGWRSAYLPAAETYHRGIYQEQVAILAPGCLEQVIAATANGIRELLSSPSHNFAAVGNPTKTVPSPDSLT